ncbi:protein kinase domain-containing protein [Nakamurella endophytica]|uniref:non-specific serine/threonine protein kinase n=1 Tax=Nakamurella endophytica TaxID=1748367 RepID=A0A917STK5_9ACTN|nr:protein kinase [Nakamurella endophytica]GGL96789.1 hypothetical protein GCM10011594_15650 [Nakamurella endophytica]
MPLEPGAVVAGHVVERQIGAGGMGEVYLARHPRLPRRVALKLLREDLVADESFVGRFRREAETVARLDHPHIVPVLDVGAEDGRVWLSMPFVDGTTAERAVADAPAGLPPARAVHIVTGVAAALDFAHRHGLVHRDVKPANILLAPGDEPDGAGNADGPDGEGWPGDSAGGERVYLSDFGVVKAMGELEAQRTALTMAGAVVATLDYAAPEQIENRPLDGRCDVYALGCVLFKLLTGRVPFPADTVPAKIYAHLHLPPPAPTDLVPTLPADIDRVIATALARDPDQRYPTARALAAATRRALGSAPRTVAPPPGAGSTGGTGSPGSAMGAREDHHARDAGDHGQRGRGGGVFGGGGGAAAAAAPGGAGAPTVADPRRMGGPIRPAGPAPARPVAPVWSAPAVSPVPVAAPVTPTPTAQPPTARPPTALPPTAQPPTQPPGSAGPEPTTLDPSWPDAGDPVPAGRRRRGLVVGAVVLLAVIATAITLLATGVVGPPRSTAATGTSATPATGGSTAAVTGTGAVIDAETRTAGTEPAGSGPAGSASTGPTGSSVASASSASSASGSATPASGAGRPAADLPRSPRPLPDATVVVGRAIGGGRYTLVRMDADTGAGPTPAVLAAPRGDPVNPLLSADRRTVLYVAGGREVRAVAADGTGDRPVTRPAGCLSIGRPAWDPVRPDRWAVTCRTAAGLELRLVDAAGRTLTTLRTGLAVVDDLSFSRDGRRLAYWGSATAGAGGGSVFVQPVDGGAPVRVTGGPADVDPVFSPVDDRVAFSRTDRVDGRRRSRILVVDTAGAGAGGVAAPGAAAGTGEDGFDDFTNQGPSWSPDGRRLAFKSTRPAAGDDPGAPEIWVVDVAGGAPARRLSGPGAVVGSPAWTSR